MGSRATLYSWPSPGNQGARDPRPYKPVVNCFTPMKLDSIFLRLLWLWICVQKALGDSYSINRSFFVIEFKQGQVFVSQSGPGILPISAEYV